LSETLTSRKLWDNYNSKSAKLLDTNSYKFSAVKILQKMRLNNKSTEFMSNLTDFITLREECAQTLNIPRNHCASDDDLILFCSHLPTDNETLIRLRLNFLPISKTQFKNKIFNLSEGLKSLKN
jgi:ribonuclease D